MRVALISLFVFSCSTTPIGTQSGDTDLMFSTSDLPGSASDLSSQPDDLTSQDLTGVIVDMAKFPSVCGMPGDVGNAKGVGKFCEKQMDCPMGTICAHGAPPLHPDAYFCTILCQTTGDVLATCGTDSICQCDPTNPALCGCAPSYCAPHDL